MRKLFYDLPFQQLKNLRIKLDNTEQNNKVCCIQDAEKHFYIGDELIFNWKNEYTV